MYRDTYVRTLTLPLFLSEERLYDLFQLCVSSSVFICFPPEEIFRSRLIGAGPVTTDRIVAISLCENNNNNNLFWSQKKKLGVCGILHFRAPWLDYVSVFGWESVISGIRRCALFEV